jgi:hypothetical protein
VCVCGGGVWADGCRAQGGAGPTSLSSATLMFMTDRRITKSCARRP